jgi:hypothetical protein
MPIMIILKLLFSFAVLIYSTAQADSLRKEILSVPCSITDSSTKTIDNGVLDNRNWRGDAKTGDSINLVFRSTSKNGVGISFEPIRLSMVRLSHNVDAENSATDGVNWITSDDNIFKWNTFRIYRQGLALNGIGTRNSIDLRYRSGNNWDGILIGDILGDRSINSIQIMTINCKLPISSWQKNFDYILKIIQEGTPSKK